jgi:hypothetical protein
LGETVFARFTSFQEGQFMSTRRTSSTKTMSQPATASKTVPPPMLAQGQASSPAIPAEKIARRAYEMWCQRGCPHGSDQQDWYQAEQELRTETKQRH